MNLDIKDLKPKLLQTLAWIRRYYALLLFIVVAVLYGYIIFQINHFNRQEPSDISVSERIKKVKRPSIDKETAEKLEQLEDRSEDVQALFENARQNPFQE